MKYKEPWADIPALRLENEQLHTENAKLRADISHWIGVSEDIERDRDKLRAALEQVEWVGESCGVFGECPWCLNDRAEGHTSDCARQSALRQSEGE
jgi:hypothetical protein